LKLASSSRGKRGTKRYGRRKVSLHLSMHHVARFREAGKLKERTSRQKRVKKKKTEAASKT